MIPEQFYTFLDHYWPQLLLLGLLIGFGSPVYTATRWALARRRP